MDESKLMGKRVRLGIIGSNFISDRIIAASRLEPRLELAAIYSRSAERGAEYAARHGIGRAFTSLDAMLGAVDAVYVASPNALHAPQAIAALDAGKHVLCEKPMASNAREACEMVAAAGRAGRVLMEAMKPTLTPQWAVVRDALPRVGTVRRWFAAFGKYSSRMEAMEAFVEGRGELPNAFNPTLANGAAMDIGVYAIYPMVQLFGRPKSLSASVLMLPSGVDGHGAVNLVWDGMLGTVLYSKMVDMALPWEIEGEAGTIRGDAINAIRRVEFRPRTGSERSARPDEWENLSSEDLGACFDASEVATVLSSPGRCGRASFAEENFAKAISSPRPLREARLRTATVRNFLRHGADENPYIDYYFELAHFVDLIESGAAESPVNSHETSIAAMEIVDEIRRQAGIVYPADICGNARGDSSTPPTRE